MLKALFSSKARIKLLRTFLLNPDKEFYVRELTRMHDEQINGIRRELANLKKIGLVRHRSRDRKKHYFVNEDFPLFQELQSIFVKTLNDQEDIARSMANIGTVDLLLLSGMYANIKEEAQVDMLVVGKVDKDKLADLIDSLSQNGEEIRYSLMTTENFIYRLQYNDSFVFSLLKDKRNSIPINKLQKFLKIP